MNFSIIAAADKNMGIGKDNELPWRIKGDLRYFSKVTSEAIEGMENAVIMGRKTWDSLPEKHRPLKNRINVVLSRKKVELPEGEILAGSLEEAFEKLGEISGLNKIFVIGGASIYKQAIEMENCERIFLTEVLGEFDCDVFFPDFSRSRFELISTSEVKEEKGIEYRFSVYENADLV